MEEKIYEILKDINEDIINYDGDNLFNDGLLDSLAIIDLVAELNETFDIKIGVKHITEENFKTKENIVSLVESLLEK